MQMKIKYHFFIHLFYSGETVLNHNSIVISNHWILVLDQPCPAHTPMVRQAHFSWIIVILSDWMSPATHDLTEFMRRGIVFRFLISKSFWKWIIEVWIVLFITFEAKNSLNVLSKFWTDECKQKRVQTWRNLRHWLKYKLNNYRRYRVRCVILATCRCWWHDYWLIIGNKILSPTPVGSKNATILILPKTVWLHAYQDGGAKNIKIRVAW